MGIYVKLEHTELKDLATFFSRLKRRNTYRIISVLTKNPEGLWVEEIQKKLNLSQSETSQHLRILREFNITELPVREGKYVRYKILPEKLEEIYNTYLKFIYK